MKLRTLVPSALAALALLAAPGHAVGSLTGTYEGKLRCETTTDGVVTRLKQDVAIEVVDDEREVSFDVVELAQLVVGFVIVDAVKAEHGVLQAISCGYDAFDPEGVVARLSVRTKLGSDKATLEGTLVRSSFENGSSALCTLDAKRVSTEPPVVEPCVKVVPLPR